MNSYLAFLFTKEAGANCNLIYVFSTIIYLFLFVIYLWMAILLLKHDTKRIEVSLKVLEHVF